MNLKKKVILLVSTTICLSSVIAVSAMNKTDYKSIVQNMFNGKKHAEMIEIMNNEKSKWNNEKNKLDQEAAVIQQQMEKELKENSKVSPETYNKNVELNMKYQELKKNRSKLNEINKENDIIDYERRVPEQITNLRCGADEILSLSTQDYKVKNPAKHEVYVEMTTKLKDLADTYTKIYTEKSMSLEEISKNIEKEQDYIVTTLKAAADKLDSK